MNFKKLDIDYFGKLDAKQRKWLYKFLIEYNFGVKTKNSFHTKKQFDEIEGNRRAFRRDVWNKMNRVLANENHEKGEETNGTKKGSRNSRKRT